MDDAVMTWEENCWTCHPDWRFWPSPTHRIQYKKNFSVFKVTVTLAENNVAQNKQGEDTPIETEMIKEEVRKKGKTNINSLHTLRRQVPQNTEKTQKWHRK